jgi:hypothetical protein
MSFFIENPIVRNYKDAYLHIINDNSYCYDNNKNFIRESNDSCYLFNGRCSPPGVAQENISLNIKIVPFITHFHTGVHAYSGVYSILYQYLKQGISKDDYKIAIYQNIQTGILDILYQFFNEDEIILLEPNVIYKFLEIKLIPNSLHSFLENHSTSSEISNLILGKIKSDTSIKYPKKIAIIKTINSSVTSTMGAINKDSAKKYCDDNGFLMIEPSEIGEVSLANYVNNCEEIILSWGTTFMKNFIYLSENAIKATVLVYGQEFRYEYENALSRDIIVKKYKNCEFNYELNKQI